jgi:hypothetical protein
MTIVRALCLIAVGVCLVFIFQNCGRMRTSENSSSVGATWQETYPFEKVESFEVVENMNEPSPKLVRLQFDHARKQIAVEVFHQGRSEEAVGAAVCSKVVIDAAEYERLRENFSQVFKPKPQPGKAYTQIIRSVGRLRMDQKVVDLWDSNPFLENKDLFDQQIAELRSCL